jgi:anti-sigma B factor antagonist
VGSLAQDTYSPTHTTIPATRVQPTRRTGYDPLVAPRGSPLVRMVQAASEIDLLTAPALADHLASALADNTPLIVVVDLQQVDFLSAAGLNVLITAHWQARHQHTTLRIVVTTYQVRRILSVTGLDHMLAIYPALHPALAI